MSSWPARQPDKGAASAAADFPGAGCRSLRARPSGFKAACGIATHATRRPCGPALTPETTAAPDGSTNGQAAACPGRHAAPGAKPLTMYGWRGKGHLPALLRRLLEPGQYTSWAFTERARASGLVPSMGSIGDCYDNAMIESFWGRMQTELLNRKRWKTRLELANAIFEYLEIFHNRRRRHSALGMLTPIEYELRNNQIKPVA